MSKRQNVLFLLADDQRYNTIHSVNCPQIKTPNIDKLVSEGTYFDNCYIEGGSSGAVCMPSRAMLLSGRSLFSIEGEGQNIPSEHKTMCEQFRLNGYETYGTGKWHNGSPAYARSFDKGDKIFFSGMWDHWNVPTCRFDETGEYDNVTNFVVDMYHSNNVLELKADEVNMGKHSTDLFGDSAIGYLDEYGKSKREKPFFLYCAFMAPHDPRTMPKKFKEMYKPEDIELPENFMTEHPFEFGVSGIRDEILTSTPRKEDEVKRHIAEYYGMISHLDSKIGEIIAKLKEIGEYENTTIVLTGDNGLGLGCHGLMGKQNLYEHSIKVPFVIKGKGVPKNEKRNQNIYLFDVFPTLCEMNNIDIPQSVQGKSFLEAIGNEKAENTRDAMYFAYTKLLRAVKKGDFKLIEYRNCAEKTQLFNIKNDPNEIKDLYKASPYVEKVKELKSVMKSLSKEYEGEHQQCKEFWENY